MYFQTILLLKIQWSILRKQFCQGYMMDLHNPRGLSLFFFLISPSYASPIGSVPNNCVRIYELKYLTVWLLHSKEAVLSVQLMIRC